MCFGTRRWAARWKRLWMDGWTNGGQGPREWSQGCRNGQSPPFLAGPEHMTGTVSPPFHSPSRAVLLVSAGLGAVGRTGWGVTVSPSPGSPLFLGKNMCHEQGGREAGPKPGKDPQTAGSWHGPGVPPDRSSLS